MSNNEQPTPIHPKSDVRNTTRKDKQTPQGSARTTSAVDLEEFCEKYYEKLLPIMADKYEHERRKKEKLEEVKARLDFGKVRKRTTKAQELVYSESRTRSPRRHRRSHSPRPSSSVFTRLKRERSRSPRHDHKNKGRKESTVLKRLGTRGRSVSAYSDSRQESLRRQQRRKDGPCQHGIICLTPHLPEMLGVWFDDLPPESIDSYDDLREAFLKNYLQQKKCIRDPIVLHNIKQREGEESGNVKGTPECMRISRFMHGITNPELIKRFHEKIPKTVDEMMQVATSFLQGQEAALNQERKKAPWLGNTRKEVTGKISKKEEASTANISKKRGRIDSHFSRKPRGRFWLYQEAVTFNQGIKTKHRERPTKKGETLLKEKPQAILIIQPWQKVVRQKITQSFSPNLEISFPSLGDDEGAEGPLIIEAEIGGHQVHLICVDGGSSFEILSVCNIS
ncbi:hypothetical protein Tco_0697548 [Tanacetum coccineum]